MLLPLQGVSFLLLIFFVPILIFESEQGWINEGIERTALFLGRASGTSCTVYESADAAHFQKFVLLRIGNVLVNAKQHLGTYALLNAVEYLERIGDRSLLHAHHIATLDDKRWLSVYASHRHTTILAGICCNAARLVNAGCPEPLVYSC